MGMAKTFVIAFGGGIGVALAMTTLVIGTGQTFGQRCRTYLPLASELDIAYCVRDLERGKLTTPIAERSGS